MGPVFAFASWRACSHPLPRHVALLPLFPQPFAILNGFFANLSRTVDTDIGVAWCGRWEDGWMELVVVFWLPPVLRRAFAVFHSRHELSRRVAPTAMTGTADVALAHYACHILSLYGLRGAM